MSGQGNNKDMRLVENREGMTNIEHHHLNKDGTTDMRHTENQREIDTSGVKGEFLFIFPIQILTDSYQDKNLCLSLQNFCFLLI